MLGRSTKAQDGCKPTNRDRILSVIGHPRNPGAVLVEEEGGVKLEDHFFIPIISKIHYLLKSMVFAHVNHIFERLAILLVLLKKGPIHPLHGNHRSLLGLIY
jgi:hypothetical protein